MTHLSSTTRGPNLFEDLQLDVNLMALERDVLPQRLHFRARDRDTWVVVELHESSLELWVDDGARERVTMEYSEVLSPGRSVSFGTRWSFHVQLLPSRTGALLGPLLLFQEDTPLPCLVVGSRSTVGRWWASRCALIRRRAQLPVFVLSASGSHANAFREELTSILDFSTELLAGDVAPGITQNS